MTPHPTPGRRRAGEPVDPPPPRWRRRGRRLVLVLVVLALAAYVGSYGYLSRRGMAEAAALNGPFFFYVPVAEITGPKSPGLARHYRLESLYRPLNDADRALFGGKSPVRGMTWGLSRPAPTSPTESGERVGNGNE